MFQRRFGNFTDWKQAHKKSSGITKWQNENCHVGYRVSLMCTETVSVTGRQFARYKTNSTRLTSLVLVLQGGQPQGMQCNFTSNACKMCDMATRDNTQYILFVCPALNWRYNERDGVSIHQPHDCLLNCLFKAQIKENIKAPRGWPLCGEFTGDRWIPCTNGL